MWPQCIGKESLVGKVVSKISSGANHSLILANRACYIVMGDASKMAKSVGSERLRTVVFDRVPLSAVDDIYSGSDHCFAVVKTEHPGTELTTSSKKPSSPQKALFGWGFNNSYQLGLSHKSGSDLVTQPIHIDTVDASGLQSIAAGDNHSLFVLKSGDVLGTGLNEDGQVGVPADGDEPGYYERPTLLALDKPVVHIVSSNHFNYAWQKDGSLISWGLGCSFVLGNHQEGVSNISFRVPEDQLLSHHGSVSLGGSHVIFAEGVNPLQNDSKLDIQDHPASRRNSWSFASKNATSAIGRKELDAVMTPLKYALPIKLKIESRTTDHKDPPSFLSIDLGDAKRYCADTEMSIYKPTIRIRTAAGCTDKLLNFVSVNN